MKKIVLLVLIALCTVSAFAGAEAESTDNGTVVLTLWDDRSNAEEARVIDSIVNDWNAAHPNVQIKRDAVDVESYKIKIKQAIAAGEAPDIFYSYGGGFAKPFANAGRVLALDGKLSAETETSALPNTRAYAMYNGKTYGLPINMWVGVLYCNEELFAEYGLEIPTTYDELIEVSKAFRNAGIGALGVGGSESWTAAMYHNAMALRGAGVDLTNAALVGEAPFDSPEIDSAAQKIQELTAANAFTDGYMGLNYDEITTLFMQGLIPMIYQGSWLAGSIEAEGSMVAGKVKAVDFPVFNDGKGDAKDFLGGAIEFYMVNADTQYPAEAIEALEYVSREYSARGFGEGMGLPVYTLSDESVELDAVTAQIVELTASANGFVVAWDTFLEGSDAVAHVDLVQQLFAGIIDADTFTERMQALQD